MDITLLFFLGLFFAAIGIIPPGLLNMTVAKISLKEGYVRSMMFSLGACAVVAFQTSIAAVFAKYLSNHPDVVKVLQRMAFVIFVLIAVYFLIVAQNQPKQERKGKAHSKGGRFLHGMFLSAINVFPIPYQAYMTLTFASFGWMKFEIISITAYVTGAVMGTFAMFYVYIFFFEKIKSKKFTSQKNMNYIIGGITLIIAIITLVKIIQESK